MRTIFLFILGIALVSPAIGQESKMSDYLHSLREQGYTIALSRQTFEKSGTRIDLGLGVINVSNRQTVKYLRIDWKLYNRVGDPVKGEVSNSAVVETEIVGPLKPRESDYIEFRDAFHSRVVSCATIKRIDVVHMNGSTFTYINDLKDIAQEAKSVKLEGDCSYEAQQSE